MARECDAARSGRASRDLDPLRRRSMTAQQGPPQPSAAAVTHSKAVAATHRSRTLAALFEEFRTTTEDNARINARAISNLFFEGNPLIRFVQVGRSRLLRAPRPRRSELALV